MEQILFVCTGNVCRSPFMENAMRWLPGLRVPIDSIIYASAGTKAIAQQPMDPFYSAALLRRGAPPPAMGARRLDPAMVNAADLILTAERRHRDQVVRLAPRAHLRTFSLGQAARLIGSSNLTASSVTELASMLATARGRVPSHGRTDDIPDPYQAPTDVQREVETLILRHLSTLTQSLCPQPRQD